MVANVARLRLPTSGCRLGPADRTPATRDARDERSRSQPAPLVTYSISVTDLTASLTMLISFISVSLFSSMVALSLSPAAFIRVSA